MAAKILYSLSEDNPDPQNQFGCINGGFQAVERRQIVPRRPFSDRSPKRLPHGNPHFDYGTPEHVSSYSYQRPCITEKYLNKTVQDKNRASPESSRDSFSSMSRSSSFSSLDCNTNKTTHQEHDHLVFPATPSRDFLTRQSCQSVDLRDVVKDSIYRHNPTVKDNGPYHLVDYRESIDAPANFQGSNWCYNEPRERSRSKSYQFRDGSSFSVPKNCPKFSYGGRETNRESSMQSLRNPKSDDVITADRGLIQSRPSGVVAKLMGLDALPDLSATNPKKSGLGPIRTSGVEDFNTFGPIQMHTFQTSSQMDSYMNPIPSFSIDPAPWKRQEGVRSSHRPVSRAMKSPTTIDSPFSSVCYEVDKRQKNIEYMEYGKDLRALKQILETMQSQSMVIQQPASTWNERFLDSQNRRGSNNFRGYGSPPIVIMKPVKLVERLSMPVDEFRIDDRKIFRNYIPKSNATEVKSGGRHTRTTPVLTKPGKSSGSISPRIPQKRPELEGQSRLPMSPVDSGKFRKQSSKQVSESSSPGGRRLKYSNVLQSDGQYREVKGELKKCLRETQGSHEVASNSEFSKESDNMQSPVSILEKSNLLVRGDKLLGLEYSSPVSVLDDGVYMEDSPSPVKHKLKTLEDDADHGNRDQWEAPDDVTPATPSSGITSEINRKKLQDIEHLVQKLTRLSSRQHEVCTDYISSLCVNTKSDDMYISEILLASGLLLRDLGSSVTAFQFHSSCHPINPELFLVLEQTKFSNLTKQGPDTPKKIIRKQKNHRKLIFDVVNEILAGKLDLLAPFQKSFTLVKKSFNAQKLLRDLCLEIEQLQVQKEEEDTSLDEEDGGLKSVFWEGVLNRAESWTDYDGEIPGITLEVERLIFKDLVNEVIQCAVFGRRIKPGRHCRQLFSK